MALNYSHRPVVPAHISDENLVSPLRIVNGCLMESVSDKNGEVYSRPWHVSRGAAEERNFNCGRGTADRCSTSESTSKDVVDNLPQDPFGMDIQTTFTAITGWLEDLEEVGCGGYMRSNNDRDSQECYALFGEWNLIWNNYLNSQPPFPSTAQLNEKWNMGIYSFPSSSDQVEERKNVGENFMPRSGQFDVKLNVETKVNTCGEERVTRAGLAPSEIGFQPACHMEGVVGVNNGNSSCSSEVQSTEKGEDAAGFESVPHDALGYALSYLGVRDLLSVQKVCKSFLSTVRGDPLLWKNIHIDQPLSERITDDIIVELASRAQGNLHCLSLVECPKVTDGGLSRILEMNPRLTKLCVPGCTRINIEFIVKSIKAFNSNKNIGGIKQVRIGGIYGVSNVQFEELKSLLGAGNGMESQRKPHFYYRGNFYLPDDDDRAIDIEMCPRCEKFRLVYDCPADSCKVKDKSDQACRACTLCIARCACCGRCVNDIEFEEMFSLELLCSGCLKELPKYQDMLDKKGSGEHYME